MWERVSEQRPGVVTRSQIPFRGVSHTGVHTYTSLVPGSGPVESVKFRILRTMKIICTVYDITLSRKQCAVCGRECKLHSTATSGNVPGPQELFVPYFT